MGFITAVVAWIQTFTPEIGILAVILLGLAFLKRVHIITIIEWGVAVAVILTAANLAPQWFAGG